MRENGYANGGGERAAALRAKEMVTPYRAKRGLEIGHFKG